MNVWLLMAAGIGLFLLGMRQVSEHLTALAGNKMRALVGRFTRTPLQSVCAGTAFTALIQSSDASNSLTIALLDAGMITLRQATGLVMGANIGTTVTGQLIAWDMAGVAPFILLPGAMMMLLFRHRRAVYHLGGALSSLGMIFFGMELVTAALEPVKQNGWLMQLLGGMGSPVAALLCAVLFTAVLQSSSAFVGLVQALSMAQVIPPDMAPYLVLGSAIGTCGAELLVSSGSCADGRRAAVIHLLINLFGVAGVLALMNIFPLCGAIRAISGGNPARYVAHLNTAFKALEVALLLPAMDALMALARKLVPDREQKAAAQRLITEE